MRYGIVSDVHANIQAWNAVLKDMKRQGVDVILCLGDVIGYGPNPAEVLESCYNHCDHFILGNHDAVIGNRLDSDLFNDNAKYLIEWTRTQLSDSAADFFAEMPLKMTSEGFTCAHGELALPGRFNYIYEAQDATESFQSNDLPLMFVGHTHFPAKFSLNPENQTINTLAAVNGALSPHERYLINVGSVGDPRDGQTTASYCIFDQDKNHIYFRHVPFDVEAFRASLLKVQLPITPFFLQVYDGNKAENQTIKDMKVMEKHQAVQSKADQNGLSQNLTKTSQRNNITFSLDSARNTGRYKARQQDNKETMQATSKKKTKIIAGILILMVLAFVAILVLKKKPEATKPTLVKSKVTKPPIVPKEQEPVSKPPTPPTPPKRVKIPDQIFAAFEERLYPAGWNSRGRAFNETLLNTSTLHNGSTVSGVDGQHFAGSLNSDMIDSTEALSLTGTLKSPIFEVTHQFLNILLYAPNNTKAKLHIIGEAAVAIQGSKASKSLTMVHLDTSKFIGKKAVISFLDNSPKEFIAFDRITFTDKSKSEFSPGTAKIIGTHQRSSQSDLFAEAGSKLLLGDFDGTLEIFDKIDNSLKRSINSPVTTRTPVLATSASSISEAKLRINSGGQFLLHTKATKRNDTYTIKGTFTDSSFSALTLDSTKHPYFNNASGTGANNMFLVPEVKMKIINNGKVIDVVFKVSPKETVKVGDLVKEFKKSYTSTKKIPLEEGDQYLIEMIFRGASEKKRIRQFPVIVTFAKASSGVARITFDKDGTCLVSSKKKMPSKNTYTIAGHINVKSKISAILLEAISDPSLPGNGPGFNKGNFVLTDFLVKFNDKAIKLSNCSADFSQNKLPITAAIDQDKKSGWSIGPKWGQNHKAVFQLAEPVTKNGKTKVKFILDQQFGSSHTLGKFRLSALSDFPKTVKEYKNIKIAIPVRKTPALLGSFKLSFHSKTSEVKRYKKLILSLQEFSTKENIFKRLRQTFIDDIGKTIELDLITNSNKSVQRTGIIRSATKDYIYFKRKKSIQYKHLSEEEIFKRLSRFENGDIAYWLSKNTFKENIPNVQKNSPFSALFKDVNKSNAQQNAFGKYIDLWTTGKATGTIQINSLKMNFKPKQHPSSTFLSTPDIPGYKPASTLIHSVYNLGRSHNLKSIALSKSGSKINAVIIRNYLGRVIWQNNVPLNANKPQKIDLQAKYRMPLKENLAFQKSFTQSNPSAKPYVGLTDGYYNDMEPFSYRNDTKPQFPKTATVDLEVISKINALRIIPSKISDTKTISFSTSTDGKTFTTAGKITLLKTPIVKPIILFINEVDARFIKISFDDHHTDKQGTAHLYSCPLAELEVYSY